MEVTIDILAPIFYDEDPKKVTQVWVAEGAEVNVGDILFSVETTSHHFNEYPEIFSPSDLDVRAEYRGMIYGIGIKPGDILSSSQIVMKICRNSERLKSNKVIKFFLFLGGLLTLDALISLYLGEMTVVSKVTFETITVRGNDLYFFVSAQICWGLSIFLFGLPIRYPKNIDDKEVDSLNYDEYSKLYKDLALPKDIICGILLLCGIISIFTCVLMIYFK